jgi:hypothetical protein
MSLNLGLILIGWASLSFLIYRYARYSAWRSTIIGQAFMMMKTALWALYTFVVMARLFPHWQGRPLVALILLGYATVAILWLTAVVVKLQGGLGRHNTKTSGTEDSRTEVHSPL